MKSNKEIETAICDYLVLNGIKKSFLAERSGIPSAAMTRLLKGERGISAIEYKRICDALGVPLETFYGE